MTSRPRGCRGVTPPPGLVGVLVLAARPARPLLIFSASFAALRSAEHYQSALLLAESRLAQTLVDLRADSQGREEGTLQPPYRWSSEIDRFTFDNQEGGIDYRVTPRLVRVSVSWGRNPAERVTLSTLRLVEEPR